MKREPWIDLVKCIAILAVLVDHVFGSESLMGRNLDVSWSYFSVSLFVLLGGFNAGRSLQGRLGDSAYHAIPWRGIRRLCCAYLAAVAVYHVVSAHGFFLSDYLHTLVSFNGAGPFYFVAFYLQLLLISPLLYALLRQRTFLAVLFVALLSHLLTRHTVIFAQSYGAGKCLFGGYFLLTYLLGMVLARQSFVNRRVLTAMGLVGIAVSVVLYCFKMQITAINGKAGFILFCRNPGGLMWMLVAASVFCIVRAEAESIERWAGRGWCRMLQALGRESLVIFLYHMLVLILFGQFVPWKHPVAGAIAFVLAAALPIVGVVSLRKVVSWWKGGRD